MYESPKELVGFLEAAALFFSRYTDFSGRSRRSEFWWAVLFKATPHNGVRRFGERF